ncbi:MAG TPA: CBS domain-containing protein [archaeon]|nr:CBS domain-containing protein [archaeon]
MPEGRHSTVADFMSKHIVTSNPEEHISQIAASMRRHNVGSIVIMKNQRLVGILTERDFVRIVEKVGMLLKEDLAKHFMAKPVITVQTSAPIADAMKLMQTNHIRHLVVLDKDLRMVGMISARDLVQAAQESMET